MPVCEDFLLRYLHTWNGEDYRDQILKLVTKIRLRDFGGDILMISSRDLFLVDISVVNRDDRMFLFCSRYASNRPGAAEEIVQLFKCVD